MPKYVFEDVPLFKGLIKDLFPGLDAPRVGYEDLKIEVASHLTQNGYKCSDDAVHKEQCDKVIQMYETMIVRYCIGVPFIGMRRLRERRVSVRIGSNFDRRPPTAS